MLRSAHRNFVFEELKTGEQQSHCRMNLCSCIGWWCVCFQGIHVIICLLL